MKICFGVYPHNIWIMLCLWGKVIHLWKLFHPFHYFMSKKEICTIVTITPYTIIVHWFQGVLHIAYKWMLVHRTSNTNTIIPIIYNHIIDKQKKGVYVYQLTHIGCSVSIYAHKTGQNPKIPVLATSLTK